MLPKFASFLTFVCLKSWCLNQEKWIYKSTLILVLIGIHKNCISFADMGTSSLLKKIAKFLILFA